MYKLIHLSQGTFKDINNKMLIISIGEERITNKNITSCLADSGELFLINSKGTSELLMVLAPELSLQATRYSLLLVGQENKIIKTNLCILSNGTLLFFQTTTDADPILYHKIRNVVLMNCVECIVGYQDTEGKKYLVDCSKLGQQVTSVIDSELTIDQEVFMKTLAEYRPYPTELQKLMLTSELKDYSVIQIHHSGTFYIIAKKPITSKRR
jgi:hypothetical protein